jgi:hypothetical protein
MVFCIARRHEPRTGWLGEFCVIVDIESSDPGSIGVYHIPSRSARLPGRLDRSLDQVAENRHDSDWRS